MNKPLISVGIPVCNGVEYLKQSLPSILYQTYSNLEIIISDDKSDDGSYELLHKFAAKYNRINLIRQHERIGYIKNFNYVLTNAKGEYFFWAAQDDLHDKEFTETLFNVMKNDPSISLAMCDYRNLHNKKLHKIYKTPSTKCMTKTDSLKYFLQTHNLSLFYGFYRTNLLKQIGGYHMDSRYYFKSSDFLTIYKTLLVGRLGFVPHVLFYKRDTGLFTKEFYHLQTASKEILTKHILRFALFPIHYVFDLVYGFFYLIQSDFDAGSKMQIAFQLIYCTVRLFVGYFQKSIKGIVTLSMRYIRL